MKGERSDGRGKGNGREPDRGEETLKGVKVGDRWRTDKGRDKRRKKSLLV